MLTQICQFLRNWFDEDPFGASLAKRYGNCAVEDGALVFVGGTGLPLLEGQYYRIQGSRLNDGVHRWGDELRDEPEFYGAVWDMRPPADVLTLAADIQAWSEKYAGADSAAMSPFTSESFGGYSYSKNAGGTAGTGGGTSWQSVFADRLAPWRKM